MYIWVEASIQYINQSKWLTHYCNLLDNIRYHYEQLAENLYEKVNQDGSLFLWHLITHQSTILEQRTAYKHQEIASSFSNEILQ